MNKMLIISLIEGQYIRTPLRTEGLLIDVWMACKDIRDSQDGDHIKEGMSGHTAMDPPARPCPLVGEVGSSATFGRGCTSLLPLLASVGLGHND